MYQHEHELPSVTKYETSLKSCNCPESIYRRWRTPCKHVATLRDAVGIIKEWEDANPGHKLMQKWTVEIPDLPAAQEAVQAHPTKYKTTLKGCSCPAHVYRSHRGPCKHVLALLDAVGVVEEWEAANPGRDLLQERTAETK